jgi:acetylornithine deacetylase
MRRNGFHPHAEPGILPGLQGEKPETGTDRSMTQPSAASRAMIERLIAFDTTSRDSNLALIDFVRDYLSRHGIASEIVPSEDGRKANLFATIGGTMGGDGDRPGVILSGHTDVVPVDGQPWVTEPFKVVERDGLIYGRGTSDMKSFVAVCLALVPDMVAARPRQPIHLAFSYDEEIGCLGVRRLIDVLVKRGLKARACIVGEPTEMRVVVGHKGKKSWRCTVHGHEAHSSLTHLGVNAVEAAAEIVAKLKSMARRFRDHGPHDRTYEPPYTSVHTGVIHGGTALNIVPLRCAFDFEFRHVPGDDPDALFAEIKNFAERQLLPEMRAVQPKAGFEWHELSSTPGLNTAEDDAVVGFAKALTGANATSRVAFGTEAGLFQQAGLPTIVCGPGSIEQAHKPNEFIALDQVAQCEAMLRRLIQLMATP